MRKNLSNLSRGVFAVAMVSVCVVGLNATADNAQAKKPGGGFECLDVWQPVLCPNGQIYSNGCYAARAGQFGCVPWGGYES